MKASQARWLALLLDREATWRHDKRLSACLRYAKLRHQAPPEDVDYRSPRGLKRRLFETLLSGEWIDAHDNLAICGPTGIGKSWLACAIGHKACRHSRHGGGARSHHTVVGTVQHVDVGAQLGVDRHCAYRAAADLAHVVQCGVTFGA